MSNLIKYPPLSDELQPKSFSGFLKIFGAGAIMASVTLGSGETIFASRGGAIFGYTILWCFVLGTIMKGFQVYSGARFITLTGMHPLESWRELPGPKGWFVWFIAIMTILWMPLWLGAGLPKMLGDFTNWVVGYPDMANADQFNFFGKVWATIFVVVSIIFTWFQSYKFLEKFQTILISLLLLCMTIAAVASSPELMKIITGSFIPSVPVYQDWVLEKYPLFQNRHAWIEMAVYLGMIGGGSQDYLGYIGLLRNKKWGMMEHEVASKNFSPEAICTSEENITLARRWLRAPLIDITISFFCVLAFTYMFIILGAAVLHPNMQIPTGFELLTVQLGYLVNSDQPAILQTFLSFIYKTGIFFTFFGTIFGAYELYSWSTRECVIAAMPRFKDVPMKKFRLATILWCGGGGLILLWTLDKNPVVLITPGALVGSALTCGLWCFAMLYSDKIHIPKALQMGMPLKVGVFISGLVLTVVPIIGLVIYVQNLF